MAKKSTKRIKFAVGPRDRPLSAMWVVSASGSDVYVGARSVMQSVKLSLHRSGRWNLAFTSESGHVSPRTGQRQHVQLDRPAEFRPGWTFGAAILVPAAGKRRLYLNPPNPWSDDDVRWYPRPERDRKRVFAIYYGSSPELNFHNQVRGESEEIFSTQLMNGEVLYVMTWEDGMNEGEWAYIRSLVEKEAPHVGVVGRQSQVFLNLFHFSTSDGIYRITDVQLGPDYVTWKESS